MKRLMEKMVFSGLVTAWRLAGVPTSRCPSLLNATTDGVVRPPSLFSRTVGSPPSRTAMHELVVPRSMPMTLPMFPGNLRWGYGEVASARMLWAKCRIFVRHYQVFSAL
jgi:hypothetical protein